MNARKKIVALSMAGLLTVGLAVGGVTFALFTDTAANEGNEFTAGTINLNAARNHGDYLQGPMFYSDFLDPDGNHPYDKTELRPSGEVIGGWAPGDKVKRTMILSNTGSLDAKLTGVKATVRESYTQTLRNGRDTRTVTGEIAGAAYEEFIDKAHVKISNPDSDTLIFDGVLRDLIGEGYAGVVEELVLQSDPSGPLNITFEVTLDRSAGNELQGKNFIFDFGFYAEQVRNND
ncbi:SipW-dependent-type signal peptide-containing protein [Brevibacillus composti]|uniref:SipW-dependent-type signal peptide-containing protein n=1 Tax=Brevibacillus composti TaxID=2796470 RepID=A0A7T5ELK7_9BACL|nr:SipW-dependent-type signal peptide-containing protein [Brevibacillus composti]QQE74839.1 hypothetical protein JD108_02305 [Brevibacillus composti]QUO41923.1 SipW-dependent-type signal peptide-containing protein [Brevibacillus composti]